MARRSAALKGAVYLVDDDTAVQRGVAALLRAADYETSVFKSAEEFLARLPQLDLDRAALLVDVYMPGMQGLELQERLRAEGAPLPVIVMTAHGDIPMAVRAMRNGAIDFLQKPFTAEEVTSALDRAFMNGASAPSSPPCAPSHLADAYASLTPRERAVFESVVGGATNKEIARALSISPRTVEVHRQHIMTKMDAANFAELVRMAVSLGVGG